MKSSLLIVRLMDQLQVHRYVEAVRFGEYRSLTYAALSSWRWMLRRRVLVVVEVPPDAVPGLDEGLRLLRSHLQSGLGMGGWWRPQSWSWLLVAPRGCFELLESQELPRGVLVFDPASATPRVLRNGSLDQNLVRGVLQEVRPEPLAWLDGRDFGHLTAAGQPSHDGTVSSGGVGAARIVVKNTF